MLVVLVALLLGSAVAEAQPAPELIVQLGAHDRATVDRAVRAVEALPTAPDSREVANVLFRAARACEDTLADPKRALALYERIAREMPNARIVTSAERKITALRAQLGAHNEFAPQAAELARLVAEAETLPPEDIERRASALVAAPWPGAPDAGMWLAEWLRRTGKLAAAQARYAEVARRWPDSPQGQLAVRGGAGNALDAHDWDLAQELATRLPAAEAGDRIVREDLIELAERGRRIDRWFARAWVVAILGFLAMLGSLGEAIYRGGRPLLRPPIEVLFLAPVAAVMIGVALTTHQLIAPAVLILSIGGLVLAWLSGATLDTLRASQREVRGRALLHVAICVFTVVALLYVALVRDNLLEMVIETVRFGPEP